MGRADRVSANPTFGGVNLIGRRTGGCLACRIMMAKELDQDSAGWLRGLLDDFGCTTGTLHRSTDGEWLDLVVAVGVPDHLMPVISRIPFGKGIAGAAAATREPVELCNLQQDLGGVAKEGARDTKVAGSLAVPVFAPGEGTVMGTLGIGMATPHDFTGDEKARLAAVAEEVARVWQQDH